jgi:hypothetical protein
MAATKECLLRGTPLVRGVPSSSPPTEIPTEGVRDVEDQIRQTTLKVIAGAKYAFHRLIQLVHGRSGDRITETHWVRLPSLPKAHHIDCLIQAQ